METSIHKIETKTFNKKIINKISHVKLNNLLKVILY